MDNTAEARWPIFTALREYDVYLPIHRQPACADATMRIARTLQFPLPNGETMLEMKATYRYGSALKFDLMGTYIFLTVGPTEWVIVSSRVYATYRCIAP